MFEDLLKVAEIDDRRHTQPLIELLAEAPSRVPRCQISEKITREKDYSRV